MFVAQQLKGVVFFDVDSFPFPVFSTYVIPAFEDGRISFTVQDFTNVRVIFFAPRCETGVVSASNDERCVVGSLSVRVARPRAFQVWIGKFVAGVVVVLFLFRRSVGVIVVVGACHGAEGQHGGSGQSG